MTRIMLFEPNGFINGKVYVDKFLGTTASTELDYDAGATFKLHPNIEPCVFRENLLGGKDREATVWSVGTNPKYRRPLFVTMEIVGT